MEVFSNMMGEMLGGLTIKVPQHLSRVPLPSPTPPPSPASDTALGRVARRTCWRAWTRMTSLQCRRSRSLRSSSPPERSQRHGQSHTSLITSRPPDAAARLTAHTSRPATSTVFPLSRSPVIAGAVASIRHISRFHLSGDAVHRRHQPASCSRGNAREGTAMCQLIDYHSCSAQPIPSPAASAQPASCRAP